MAEFIARFLDEAGIPPLILTRGYAGGDEAKMLRRHLEQTSAKIGVGANRSAVARSILDRYGHMDPLNLLRFEEKISSDKSAPGPENEKVGAVILDDGMQHWSLLRDVEIVMLNSLMPWGNNHLLPRGSLREPFSALVRADIVVIHHADLVCEGQLKIVEYAVQKVSSSILIYFTKLAPSYFFDVKNPLLKLPLSMVQNKLALCVSAIGFPDAFVHAIKKIGPLHVDRVDFSDHHIIEAEDVRVIRKRLQDLQDGFRVKAIMVVTEKDYDRDPVVLRGLDDITVLVLCSSVKIIPSKNRSEENFKKELMKLLVKKHGADL